MNAPKFNPGFIQSTVVLHVEGAIVGLPPVVGRSLADSIARMIRIDFPRLVVTVDDHHHDSHAGLGEALVKSDMVAHHMELALSSRRPGQQLLNRLGLLDEVIDGGVQ